MKRYVHRLVDAVTSHNRIAVLLMLALTVGMVAGIGQIDTGGESGQEDVFPETETSLADAYIDERYGSNDSSMTAAVVYVHEPAENALSQESLLTSLRYQQTVLDNESVASQLHGSGPVAVPNLVAQRLAEGPSPTLAEQIDALERASQDEIAATVATLGSEDARVRALLPRSYEPGAAGAEGHRMVFQFDGNDERPPSDAQHALFAAASDRPAYFTLGEHASAEANAQMNANTMQLVLPIALLLVVGILAVTYRNLVDILVGLVGVLVSVLWMFGILGWLGIEAGMTMVIGPVLIVGLSIDFSFHVFNRYREQRRPDEGIRAPMTRSVSGVALALGLVALTAAIGFLSNLANPVAMIRDLGVGITLGVLSAFVVFVTLVPALKISIDGLLERLGFDRHSEPLGHGTYLRPLLAGSVTLAKRAAPVVIVVALVAGSAGGAAWTTLEEENFQQQTEAAAEWKTNLPGPVAWEDPEFNRNLQYVQSEYRAVASAEGDRFQILVEGDVSADGTLAAVQAGTDRPVFAADAASDELVSPLTVIRDVAGQNDEFAATVAAADTTGDGVPDTDLEAVYDHLYAVAPEAASRVVEREDGQYRSLRILGPAESAGFGDDRSEDVQAAASAIEDEQSALDATAVSNAIVLDSQLDTLTDGILQVLVVALLAVFGLLVVAFRVLYDSATLGVLTGIPIVLVTGFVVGGMAVLDVPLTLITALLMSLVIGLGIDYNIHLTDRFVQELEGGRSGFGALETAVTGTGGALLGSALTSSGAFLALLLHPHPQIESFGILVILAMTAAFVASVVVLPSLLAVWVRRVRPTETAHETPAGEPVTTD